MDMDNKLGVWDYVVFVASLLSSVAIGLYYHFSGGRNQTNRAYLLGDKNLSIWPVSMSLMASFMSAITLLGVPAENYMFSTQFLAINISYIIGTPICAYVFLPVFFQLQNTSAYEYLEMRFNRPVRIAASSIFMLQMILYMGIVLYAPALALSAVTGLSKWTSIISVGVVCTLYCTTGGIKAVVWTDLLQSFLMFAAIICVAIRGVILVGGFHVVMERARNGNRLQFWNMDPDPTIRHSFWTLTIGGVFIYTSLYGVNQTQVQRLLTVRSLKKAQIALVISWPITSILSLVTSFTGIVMYAYFEGCDPLKSKVIERSDQMLPYFMMKVVASYPGLPGLFVAGIFSGALSSVSSFVNSLAAVTLEDFLKPHFPSLRNSPLKDSSLRKDSLRNDDENCENSGKKEGGKNRKGNKRKESKTEEKTGEKMERIESNKETLIAKGLALFFGLLCLALTYVAEQMAGILQASLTIFGVVGGPLLGLFTLGMCTRSCSSKAAFISFLTSLLLGFWIGFGSLSSGLKPIPLDTSTLKCNISTTAIQLSPITSFSISSKISSLSISSPKITSFPSLLSPSNSNVEYLRKRSKRAGKEMRSKRATEEKLGRSKRDSVLESMMVNTITSATNNEYSKEGSNHNGSNGGRNESINGFGTRGSNGRNNGYINGGIHGNRKSHEQLHQPVNLVHHSPPSLTSNRDQEYLQFMTTEPASSFSSSLSPSSLLSSSLSPSRWRRIKSSHKKSKSTKKKERILSSDSDVQSTQAVRNHDYNFLDYSLYESYSQFDHDEHLGEGTTGMERREKEEEMEGGKEKEGKKEETNSEGGEVKEQQVVIMNESVLVAKDLSPEMTRNKGKMRERGGMSKVVSKEKEAYSQGSKMGEKRGRRSTGNDKDQNVESAPLTVSEGFKVTNDGDGHFQSDPTTDPNNGGNDVDSNFNPLNLDPVLVVRFDSDNHHDSHSLSFDSKPQSKFDSLPFDSHSVSFDSHSLLSDSNLQPQFEYLTNNGSNEGLIDPSSVFYLYKLSYMYLAGFTCLFEIILGLLLSYTIFPNRNEVRPELLTPLLNRGIFRHRANDYFIGPQDGVNGTLSGGIPSLNKREEEKSKIDGKNSSQIKSKNVGEMEMTTMVTRT